MMRILAVAGASGGHIFPAIGFLDGCKAAYPDTQTLLVVPRRSIRGKITVEGHGVADIGVSALSLRPSSHNLVAGICFIQAFFESLVILARFKPDIVVGFGSIASIPLVLVAWLSRATVIIHEQNVVPGTANRFLAFVADRIAISFPQSEVYFRGNREKVVWTGTMIRSNLVMTDKRTARKFFNLDPDVMTILVMGGSQASRRINFGFTRIFKDLPWGQRCQVIHLCGEADKADLEKAYAPHGDSVRLVPFLMEMQYAYSASDLVVSRAGATTIAELIAFRLPAILIPYPYAHQHQYANARVLEYAGCAVIVADERVDSGELLQGMEVAANNLASMRQAYDRLNSATPASLVAEAVRVHHHG